MLYFKRLIQIPRLPEVPAPSSGRRRGCSPPCPCAGMGLGGRVVGGSAEGGASWLLGRGAPSSFHPLPPQGPPNFLRASALAEHIKPVVVIPEEAPEDEEPENLIEISTGPPAGEPAVSGAPSLPPSLPPPSLGLLGERGGTHRASIVARGRWWRTSSSRPLDPPMAL